MRQCLLCKFLAGCQIVEYNVRHTIAEQLVHIANHLLNRYGMQAGWELI